MKVSIATTKMRDCAGRMVWFARAVQDGSPVVWSACDHGFGDTEEEAIRRLLAGIDEHLVELEPLRELRDGLAALPEVQAALEE